MQEIKQRIEKAERFINFTKWAEISNPTEASETLQLIKELQARNAKLVEALKFYVDKNNYQDGAPMTKTESDCGEPAPGKILVAL